MNPPKPLLTYQDLCAHYGVHRDTMRALIKRLPEAVRKTCICAPSRRTIRFRTEILDYLAGRAIQIYLVAPAATPPQPQLAPIPGYEKTNV